MANTIIQIKRSSITTSPASLQAAEPAYSYLSDKLFLGDASGAVIEIGGRYYINVAQQSWNTANAAFAHANAAFAYANTISSDADEKANAAIITANASFDAANAAFAAANTGTSAGAAFNAANAAFAQGNTTATSLSANWTATNSAFTHANSAFDTANIAIANVNYVNTATQAAFGKANSAESIAIAAYQNSNTKLATTGGTITGDLSVTGNLVILGNSTVIVTETLQVSDPLIYLAGNNYLADLVDIGFIANYVNATGANVHTGLYREHENKMYYLFQGYDKEPANNHIGAFSNNMTLAVLNADLITSNLTLTGLNAATWITAAFDKANTGDITGSAAFDKANSANVLAYNTGIGANAYASAVGTAANLYADQVGVSANLYAAAVGVAANAFASATIAGANTISIAAFAQANAASAQAANADFLTSGTVDSARISGSYTGITGLGTITVGTWQANTINVNYGGTGLSSISNNAILYATGSSTKLSTATGSDGNVLQINSHGTPFFGMLDGGAF